MQKKLLFLAIFFLIFGGILTYTIKVTENAPQAKRFAIPTKDDVHFQEKLIEENEPEGNYSLQIEQPILQNLPPTFQSVANQQIEDYVVKTKNDFINQSKTTKNISEKNSMRISYVFNRLDKQMVSIWFFSETHINGVDATTSKTFNFDLKNQKDLQISELFTDFSKATIVLNTLVKKDLLLQFADENSEKDKIEKSPSWPKETFVKFNFSDGSISLIFDPGTVASADKGVRQVRIEKKDIQDLLKSEVSNLL